MAKKKWLVPLLSDGDFYRTWCVDPQNDGERDQKKSLLNILLNKRNENCKRNILYRRIRAEFPITFRIVEDIKRSDHRNLSKQLHRFTADAIAAALLEVQREKIAAIPHVDALICQQKDQERVCEVIGRQIFEATGVCCSVGGIRYSPLTENEKQALAFDEIAPSDDGMNYDKWEEMRALKTAAVLKRIGRMIWKKTNLCKRWRSCSSPRKSASVWCRAKILAALAKRFADLDMQKNGPDSKSFLVIGINSDMKAGGVSPGTIKPQL